MLPWFKAAGANATPGCVVLACINQAAMKFHCKITFINPVMKVDAYK